MEDYKAKREQAGATLKGFIFETNGYQAITVERVRRILGEEKFEALSNDRVRYLGPTKDTVYPWNVLDYLTCKIEDLNPRRTRSEGATNPQQRRNKVYQLELNQSQIHVLINALDLFARIHIGQIKEIRSILSDGPYTPEQLDRVEDLCNQIKAVLGFAPNASFGIFNDKVPQAGRTAWDIEAVVRQIVAKAENHGSHSVWRQDPMHADPNTPLCKCTYVESKPDE